MSASEYGPGIGPAFERHAAPEAIAAHLKRTREAARRYTRWANNLERLHALRTEERERGEWPYRDCCELHVAALPTSGQA